MDRDTIQYLEDKYIKIIYQKEDEYRNGEFWTYYGVDWDDFTNLIEEVEEIIKDKIKNGDL